MAKLLTDPVYWSRKQAAGLERARAFNWDDSLERHARVYDRVLSGL
jgi:hypothetical protein